MAVAFVAVALVAVAVLTVAVLLVDRSDVNRLAAIQRDQTIEAVSSALQDAYRAGGGWSDANLQPAVELADSAGVGLAVHDQAGGAILRAGPQALFTRHGSTVVVRPISIGSQSVGGLRLAFPGRGLSLADRNLLT